MRSCYSFTVFNLLLELISAIITVAVDVNFIIFNVTDSSLLSTFVRCPRCHFPHLALTVLSWQERQKKDSKWTVGGCLSLSRGETQERQETRQETVRQLDSFRFDEPELRRATKETRDMTQETRDKRQETRDSKTSGRLEAG